MCKNAEKDVSVPAKNAFAENHTISFSVIMPCYNSEAYVYDAVASVMNQTYPYWELITVNDGSTDKTLEILQDLSAKDSRIKVLSKENGGYASAVNVGLDAVSGDYFLMMGSDDALGEDLFSQLVAYTGESFPDCIAWRTVLVRNGEKLELESYTRFSQPVSEHNVSISDFSQHYPDHAPIFSIRDTSKCYKRALLGDLRYFGRYGLDADGIFSMLLCHRARSFAVVPTDGYFWTLRGDSVSSRKSSRPQDLDRLENWMKFYSCLTELNPEEITEPEKTYLTTFLSFIETAWASGHPFFQDYTLVKRALGVFTAFTRKTNYQPPLPMATKLFRAFPVLWKFCYNSPIRDVLHKIKSSEKD